MNKGLTLTIVFEASSLNYGDGMGNIASLKKVVKADGKTYSYISRQALRYNIVEQLGCNDTPTDNKSGVVQFSPEATIDKYPEIDYFGYMKTEKGDSGQKSSAVVRLSNADSLMPFASDLDFLNNMGLAARCKCGNDLASSEIHHSMYSYTMTIDLERLGIDGDIEIPTEEKIERVCKLLDVISCLHRDIKGRTENLNPIFMIGGLYDTKNPFFHGSVKLKSGKLDCDLIADTIENSSITKEHTLVSAISGRFVNEEEVRKICTDSMSDMFDKLKKEVRKYYESNTD